MTDQLFQIDGENMIECLNSMGLGTLSKDALLSRILGEGVDKGKSASKSPADETQLTEATEQSNAPTVTPHPAQFVLPESLLWCSLPSYSRLYPSDDVMSLDVDKDELKRELKAEKALDLQDKKSSKDFEARLWKSNLTKTL